MSSRTEVPPQLHIERSASSVARALLRKSSGMNKRIIGSHASHMTTGGIRKLPSQSEPKPQLTNGVSEQILKPLNSFENGNVTDDGESTAEAVDSSTTDNFPNSIDPIDFIENNPRLSRLSHYTHTSHTSHMMGGGRGGGHRYENWSMFVSEKEFQELARKNKAPIKRSKPTRGGKTTERQRLPHPLPRVANKIKSVRMINAPRKRRLSGRLARPPQLSNASEEGDMAQADEMGEGEGRDDGFVDGGEAVRKRNRKKPGEGKSLE